jgi:Ca2+-binding RTX toxin-like protein
VNSDVIVFADTRGDHSAAEDAVILQGRTLADISADNIMGATNGSPPPPPVSPPPPINGAHTGATVNLFDGADMGAFQESQLSDATVTRTPTSEVLVFGAGTAKMTITGSGLVYDATGKFVGGTVTGLDITSPNGHFALTGVHTDATILAAAHDANNADLSTSALLSGDDVITVQGSAPGADTSFTAQGWGGNDLMIGGGSLSTFSGGDGNDTLQAGGAAQTYLRGDNGDDSLQGGSGFDDINGNKGNDTIDGGSGGGDWLVGGQGNDLVIAHVSNNILYGNLGNDTLIAGGGLDTLRGGQGDDSIVGGAGADWISGDRGNDTESGGGGADTFHTSQDAGVDRVLDFHQSEGDRVMLDPGTTFTVSQMGSDTVIDLGGGNEMILVGVQMSTLTPGWIFGA